MTKKDLKAVVKATAVGGVLAFGLYWLWRRSVSVVEVNPAVIKWESKEQQNGS